MICPKCGSGNVTSHAVTEQTTDYIDTNIDPRTA